MYVYLTVAFTIAFLGYCLIQFCSLRRHIDEAKATELPYIVAPFGFSGILSLLLQAFLVSFLNRIPDTWTERWIPYLLIPRGWHKGYEPFAIVGSDTYIVVSPTGNILYTCDPVATNQLFRKSAFDKPADLTNLLDIFGPVLTGAKNQESRSYRKVVMPFFNEETMAKVWRTSISGVDAFLKGFTNEQEDSTRVDDLGPILTRLTLHIMNTVCYDHDGDCLSELQDREPVPKGHRVSYTKAMRSLIDQLQVFFITPPFLLRNSILPLHRQARKAYAELRRHLEDVRDRTTQQIQNGSASEKPSEELNLADLLVGASDLEGTVANPPLSPPAVLGNIFVFMFAGHESSSNALLFIIILLACHPEAQKDLQNDIDHITAADKSGLETTDKHSYLRHYDALSQGLVGAVINEAMRLFTVLPFLAKCVPPGSAPQPLKLSNNRTHKIPVNTLILVNTSAIHRHPQYWPEETSSLSAAKHNPVAAFNPHRWLKGDHPQDEKREFDNASGFLHPAPGTYIPFSDGIRGCIGKKFALVEVVALMTRIFSQYSVELAVEGTDSDEGEEKEASWNKARIGVEKAMYEGVTFKTSLKLANKVPVVFVKRGSEQFRDF